jgi:hypothetical protein
MNGFGISKKTFKTLNEKIRSDNILLQLRSAWISEAMWNKKPPLGKWGGFKTVEERKGIVYRSTTMLRNVYAICERDPKLHMILKNLSRTIKILSCRSMMI